MTFKEKYLAGEIRFGDRLSYIEIWNNSDGRTRHSFWGLAQTRKTSGSMTATRP